ncbi:hypothetical protein BDZ89DRAFT_764853 [Hymenopellis radicata]|nr:hypothetical protein BDZ89DRAFT_764853 [Hymenopellis radicata]
MVSTQPKVWSPGHTSPQSLAHPLGLVSARPRARPHRRRHPPQTRSALSHLTALATPLPQGRRIQARGHHSSLCRYFSRRRSKRLARCLTSTFGAAHQAMNLFSFWMSACIIELWAFRSRTVSSASYGTSTRCPLPAIQTKR